MKSPKIFAQVTGDKTVEVTVVLDAPAPPEFSLSASSDFAKVTVPPSISIPAGSTTTIVQMSVAKAPGRRVVKVTIGGQSFSITLLPKQ